MTEVGSLRGPRYSLGKSLGLTPRGYGPARLRFCKAEPPEGALGWSPPPGAEDGRDCPPA